MAANPAPGAAASRASDAPPSDSRTSVFPRFTGTLVQTSAVSVGLQTLQDFDVPVPSESVVTPQETKRSLLLRRIPLDVTAAAVCSFAVAPFVSIVDKSIISNASGRHALLPCLLSSLKLLVQHPLRFLRRPEFQWIWGLYAVTYTTANVTESICAVTETADTIPKLAATTAVNVSVCVTKDRAFARMFGVGAPGALPAASYALFAARDMLTVFASFTVPKVVAGWVDEPRRASALNAAQMSMPLLAQVVSTPMHLLGLDLYNRKESVGAAGRARFIAREYVKSTLARIARIGPAYALGGVGNRTLLTRLRERFL